MSDSSVLSRREPITDPLHRAIWSKINGIVPRGYGDSDIDALAETVVRQTMDCMRAEVKRLLETKPLESKPQ